jgi:hypothetical protein
MRISTDKTSIQVEFVDAACDCRRTIKLEVSRDGERVTITSLAEQREQGVPAPLDEVRVETLSAVKAIAAAMLLLEV